MKICPICKRKGFDPRYEDEVFNAHMKWEYMITGEKS